ncbi:MAG: phage shock protein operon transcriptional activator [Azospirillaceae bacterium]|nr:phage shock protein operon transcriptional activator [Azospirillaceae bacterium]
MATPLPPVIGTAPLFLAALEQASRLAPLAKPVLVVGERGTGKELIAARLHYLSPRWAQPFIKLNCAALPETLLESELFGHEAGAFTGASRRRPGRFELADGGTLFLDEIATASSRVQEQVLRVIEYGEFERVGGRETLSVEVRLIGATHADLPALAAAGRFRADLLDRLAFDVITLPPLRARVEDIPVLAQQFGQAMAHELGHGIFAGFGPAALAALMQHNWPGNVRELKNVVERAVYRAADPAQPVDSVILDPFAPSWCAPQTGTPAPAAERPHGGATPDETPPTEPPGFEAKVRAFEISLLRDALHRHNGSQKQAAEDLGLGYHQFRHYLRKYPDLSKA